jgi:hypothetical protein
MLYYVSVFSWVSEWLPLLTSVYVTDPILNRTHFNHEDGEMVCLIFTYKITCCHDVEDHNLNLLYLSLFLALSWNVPLPGNFQSRILESIKNHETGNEAEIVFPSLPPAFVDTKESNRSVAVELKHPTSMPQAKKRRISGFKQRRNKKKASRVPPSCMCLPLLNFCIFQWPSTFCILHLTGHFVKNS